MADNNDNNEDNEPIIHDVINIDDSLLLNPKYLSMGSIISESGHSIVYEGLYKSMPVAIKVMQPDQASAMSPDRREKFVREVTMLSRVKHENLVMFIGASVEPTMIIVTELMKGGTLKKYLWSIRPSCLDLHLSISFALDICRAMECLHANGIIHRDLNPCNFCLLTFSIFGHFVSGSLVHLVHSILKVPITDETLFAADNLLLTEDQKKLKVADFGLAREAEEEMTAEAGTYRWMAPELCNRSSHQLGEKKHYDHKVDVYSFSMVLWELLTNCTPFKKRVGILATYDAMNNVRPSVDNLPKGISSLLQSCWAEDPGSRPEFTVIARSLLDFLNSLHLPKTTPEQVLEIEQPKNDLEVDSAGTSHQMEISEEMESNKSASSLDFLDALHLPQTTREQVLEIEQQKDDLEVDSAGTSHLTEKSGEELLGACILVLASHGSEKINGGTGEQHAVEVLKYCEAIEVIKVVNVTALNPWVLTVGKSSPLPVLYHRLFVLGNVKKFDIDK
ncbi:hypothetical protein HHK36_008485 [Tetracentron sinense]|uniref:Protein kinase domain-containing protein n=1 Tax=Tetracentron sinense TaxID=13715 RepID=A0A835DJD4_TETSI|nr:hypothetical protein HHK36_008485 [Tetracentron sinense]